MFWEIKLLLVTSFADTLSWPLDFHFIYGFLWYAKLVGLIRSHLLIFAYISIVLGD